jgi:hypothetical protein
VPGGTTPSWIHHLLASGAALAARPGTNPQAADRARGNAMAIDFGTFKSQVLAYLAPDAQAQFDSAHVWDTMVLEVVEALQGGRA